MSDVENEDQQQPLTDPGASPTPKRSNSNALPGSPRKKADGEETTTYGNLMLGVQSWEPNIDATSTKKRKKSLSSPDPPPVTYSVKITTETKELLHPIGEEQEKFTLEKLNTTFQFQVFKNDPDSKKKRQTPIGTGQWDARISELRKSVVRRTKKKKLKHKGSQVTNKGSDTPNSASGDATSIITSVPIKNKKDTVGSIEIIYSFQTTPHKYSCIDELLFSAGELCLPSVLDALELQYANGSLPAEFGPCICKLFYYNDEIWNLLELIVMKEIYVQGPTLFLRENSLGTHILSEFLSLDGMNYLTELLILVKDFASSSKLVTTVSVKNNVSAFRRIVTHIVDQIVQKLEKSYAELSPIIIKLCQLAANEAQRNGAEMPSVMSAILFLRYISPAIVSPERSGVSKTACGDDVKRILVVAAKVLQQMANGLEFEEEKKKIYNSYIKKNTPRLIAVFQKILKHEVDTANWIQAKPLPSKIYVEILRALKTYHKTIRENMKKDPQSLRYRVRKKECDDDDGLQVEDQEKKMRKAKLRMRSVIKLTIPGDVEEIPDEAHRTTSSPLLGGHFETEED